MPLRPPLNVQHVVTLSVHLWTQDLLQLAAEGAGPLGDIAADPFRTLPLPTTYAHYIRRKDRVCYIAVVSMFRSGHRPVARWRVPISRNLLEGPGLVAAPTWVRDLENFSSADTLSGARAGSGRLLGESRQSRPRSRPEIGRAYKRRGR